MEFEIITLQTVKHCMATEELLSHAIRIKEDSWAYGERSQREWLKSNVRDDDYHCFLRYGEEYIGYCTLSSIQLSSNNDTFEALGLGCVCISNSKKKQGWGSLLVKMVSQIIKLSDKPGVLFCRDDLVSFYSENGGWKLWDQGEGTNLHYNGNLIDVNVMCTVVRPEFMGSVDRLF